MEHLNSPLIALPIIVGLWFARELFSMIRGTLTTEAVAPTPEPIERNDYFIAATIAVSFYLLCLWRLGEPPKQYFDEVHHVRTAMEYVVGQDPHEWTHPPLAKLMMAASLKLFGEQFDPSDSAWKDSTVYSFRTAIAWRFPSVCFAAFALLAMYAFTRALFDNRVIAMVATILLSLDGVFFVHSRIGMTNIFTVCFILLATFGTWQSMKFGDRRFLILTGIALGLALSTRWSSLWAWGLNALLALWYLWRVEFPRWQEERKVPLRFAGWAATMVCVFFLVPLSLYAASYLPFVLQGKGTVTEQLFTHGEPGPPDWGRVWERDNYASGHGWIRC